MKVPFSHGQKDRQKQTRFVKNTAKAKGEKKMTNIEIIVNALLDNGVIEEEEALELVENDELKDYKSFEQWKQLGFSIKKGEHRLASCLIWKPEETTDEDGKKASRFVKRWANIFSKEQVEKTADRKARRKLEKTNAQKTEEPKKAEETKANSQKAKKAEPKAKKELAPVKTEKPKAETKKNSKKVDTKKAKSERAVKVIMKEAENTIKEAEPKKNSKKTVTKSVKTTEKKASKTTKKTEVGKMSSRIEQGKEIIRIDLEKADGTFAWIEMTKDFFMGMKKTQKKQLEKMWGLA